MWTEAAGRTFDDMTDDPFVLHRGLLFTVAYEMLGSATDAEDVVQETWLRWDDIDQSGVDSPRTYLVRVVTRQALNRLRTESRRREDYVGEWLPEPLLTSPDVAEDVELAESVSIAMLTVLETLGPSERAVFVLREVFDTPYDEIAEALGKTPEAVRQVAHRARKRVAARRPRMQVDPAERQVVVDRFLSAVSTGDVQGLMDVLAPNAVAIADGGGVAPASRKPIIGAEKLAALFGRLAAVRRFVATSVWLNGTPGIRIDYDGGTAAMSMVIENGRITHIYAINNPNKLGGLETEVSLHR
jgi:RNA polymerase sigma-70 factor (TIGR02957 family)